MPEVAEHLKFIAPKPLQPKHPLFVYLPGMDGTGELLHNQVDSLAESFDIRCLAIPSNDMSNWDSLSVAVIPLIEQELQKKPQRSVYLCGESFGACLALKVALSAPSLVKRLILINAASSFNQRPLLGLGISLTQWIPAFLHQNSAVGVLLFLAALQRIAPSDRRALLKAMQSVPQKTVSWRLSLLKNFAVKAEDLNRLTLPVLVIAGAADQLLPSVDEATRLVKQLPNAQMLVLPHSGHACLLETDIRLYEILKQQKFLDTNVSSLAMNS